jgi:hypothetical protein
MKTPDKDNWTNAVFERARTHGENASLERRTEDRCTKTCKGIIINMGNEKEGQWTTGFIIWLSWLDDWLVLGDEE